MADWTPSRLWTRFLALPIESRGKTLAMAFAVALVSSLIVSVAAPVLQPRIEANREAERQTKLERMIAELPALADLLSRSGADRLETLIIDLSTGLAADIEPDGFDMAAFARDPATSTELDDASDIARIGRRPDYAQVHLLKDAGELALAVFPVYGTGYQSTIQAYLALQGDLNTVAGLVITGQGETPGLGAMIAEPDWQALWPGKEIADADGTLRLTVVRGTATSSFEVDGIAGATRTSKGVGAMIAFWMGPNGYGPALEALRAGKL